MRRGAVAVVLAMTVAGCSTASDVQVVSGGMFSSNAAVIGSVTGGAGRSAIIGGTGVPTPEVVFRPDYGAYDYRTRSYGTDSVNTRCVRVSTYTGNCAAWRVQGR